MDRLQIIQDIKKNVNMVEFFFYQRKDKQHFNKGKILLVSYFDESIEEIKI